MPPPPDAFEGIVYETNYLTDVIARVDLASPIESVRTELPKSVSQVALEHYPIEEPREALLHQVRMNGTGHVDAQKQAFTEWHFHGRERGKHLKITPNAIIATYNRYEAYEGLRAQFIAVFDAFVAAFPETQPSRLGLRYINQLIDVGQGDPLGWGDYISDDLLHLLRYRVPGARPSRIFHTLDLVYDGYDLTFQFGIHNSNHPAPIVRREFILDLDAHHSGPVDASDVEQELDKYHTAIQLLFEQSIKDGLRAEMRKPR